MKRYNNLWDKIIDKENIKLAHKMARKDKSFYSEVKYVDENLDECVNKIYDMLNKKRIYNKTKRLYKIYKMG